MRGSDDQGTGLSFTFDSLATAVLDEQGTILRWSPTAAELLDTRPRKSWAAPGRRPPTPGR
ncbi:hypothetical protein ABZ499_32550 [Streptomyces sp. NPDC019990]|uniref:hypothetical protein n=1 Tax=Streptomyces sp. NPDC019990 TaxID=3154693 RepID=UPI0033CA3626